MNHETSTYRTPDNQALFTQSWLPDNDPRAVVLIVHGLAEHAGRYGHVAAALVQQGLAVYGIDHRGHGKSPGMRAYFESFDYPVEDLKGFLDSVRLAQPGKKIFLYGHSLGSLISLVYALRHQSDLAGMVISGCTLDVEAAQSRMLINMANMMNTLAARMAITPPLDSKLISHDLSAVQAYDSDPLVYRGAIRIRMGFHIIHQGRAVRAGMNRLTLPLFILHGSEDKICPPNGSQVLHDGIGSSDKTLRFYPGMYHECHNEIDQNVVINDITGWLVARL